MHTRRQFLHSTLAASGLALGAGRLAAIEPIKRNGKSHIRLSIAAYSYNALLNLKNPSMTLDDFVDQAAGMDLDAVEFTAYYFPKTDAEYLATLKGRCTRLGLDVSGTAVGNNFATADAEKYKKDMAMTKAWIEHTARLGGKTMRIFAGSLDKGDKDEEKARQRCIEGIQEACDHAAKYGVILALENHGGITATPDQILAIVKGVKHDWFGINLDTGNFHTEDPYADLEKLAPYTVTVQIKSEIHRAGKKKEDADYKRLIGMLRAVNYRGYVALEYEGSEDRKTGIPKAIEALKPLVRG
jgi:sugar phosphate isomerase/epimerase